MSRRSRSPPGAAVEPAGRAAQIRGVWPRHPGKADSAGAAGTRSGRKGRARRPVDARRRHDRSLRRPRRGGRPRHRGSGGYHRVRSRRGPPCPSRSADVCICLPLADRPRDLGVLAALPGRRASRPSSPTSPISSTSRRSTRGRGRSCTRARCGERRPGADGGRMRWQVSIDILDEDHSLELAMRRLALDAPLRERLGAPRGAVWEANGHAAADARRLRARAGQRRGAACASIRRASACPRTCSRITLGTAARSPRTSASPWNGDAWR